MSVNPTETADRDLPISPRRPSLAEQARAKGTPVIRNGDELMDGELFADDAEHEEFLAFVRESRRADLT
jgi:hypothetical protein